MIGYGNGQKLSSLLRCTDFDFKIAMLEEYLGVCSLYIPEMAGQPELLHRKRSDTLYKKYQEEEIALTGKAAPICLHLIAELPGKLFWDFLGRNHLQSIKPHCFLYGYTCDNTHDLTPVCFTGKNLEPIDLAAFSQDRIRRTHENSYFQPQYGTPYKATFSDDCSPAYRGRSMTPPNGFYPENFTKAGELLLQGNQRIYVVDNALNIIAKLSIKGTIADIVDDYILTTTGDGFCGYCFEPKAKIYIYEIVRKPRAEKELSHE